MKVEETFIFGGEGVELNRPLKARSGKDFKALKKGTKVRLRTVNNKLDLVRISTEGGREWLATTNDYFNAVHKGKVDEVM